MSTIQLRTPIPGSKSKALAARRAQAVPRGLSHGTPIYVAKAEGAWLEDVDGNRYIDFAGGIGCLNVGHRREAIVRSVREQLDRFSYSPKYPSCDLYCARHLEDTFKRVVANEEVAAVIAEPVLGEGGFVAPPPDYFKVLVDLCHKYGVLFIADEVQSGFGRTGAMFASERYGIEPDILVTAKSLGGGLPLAGVTGRAEIMDAPGVGGMGGTFAGNPLSCAAALAVLDPFERQNLLARANELGERFQKQARSWQKRWPVIGDVRGLGAM